MVDRLKDIIITAGFNVYPAAREAVLRGHPSVAMAAVVGVPDSIKGELARAFVCPRQWLQRKRSGASRVLPDAARNVQGSENRDLRRRPDQDCIRKDLPTRIAPVALANGSVGVCYEPRSGAVQIFGRESLGDHSGLWHWVRERRSGWLVVESRCV